MGDGARKTFQYLRRIDRSNWSAEAWQLHFCMGGRIQSFLLLILLATTYSILFFTCHLFLSNCSVLATTCSQFFDYLTMMISDVVWLKELIVEVTSKNLPKTKELEALKDVVSAAEVCIDISRQMLDRKIRSRCCSILQKLKTRVEYDHWSKWKRKAATSSRLLLAHC